MQKFTKLILVFLLYFFICLANLQSAELINIDRFEPNNDIKSAKEIPLINSFSIELTKSDRDWFTLNVNDPGILILHYENMTKPKSPTVEIYKIEAGKNKRLTINVGDKDVSILKLDKGKYLVKFWHKSLGTKYFVLRVNYIIDRKYTNSLFMLGMELNKKQNKRLRRISGYGAGRMLVVSSRNSNLTLALAKVVVESRGNIFSTQDYLATMVDEIFSALSIQPNEYFNVAWLGGKMNGMAMHLQDPAGHKKIKFTYSSIAELLQPIPIEVLAQKQLPEFSKDYISDVFYQIVESVHKP